MFGLLYLELVKYKLNTIGHNEVMKPASGLITLGREASVGVVQVGSKSPLHIRHNVIFILSDNKT